MSVGSGVKARRSVDHAMPSGPGATFAGDNAGLLLLPGDEPIKGFVMTAADISRTTTKAYADWLAGHM